MRIWLKLLLFFTVYGEILIVAYVSCRFTRRHGEAGKRQKIIFIAGTLALAVYAFMNKELNYFSGPGYFLEVLLAAILLCFVRPKTKVLICSVSTFLFLTMAYLDLSLSFMLTGIRAGFNFTSVISLKESLARSLLYILSRLIVFAFCLLINRFMINAYSVINKYKIALLVMDGIGIAGFIYFRFNFIEGRSQLNVPDDFAIFLLLGILFLGFCLYYFWRKMKEQEIAIQIHNDFMEQHYKRVMEEQKKAGYIYHDFRNHLNLLSEYIKSGDYIKAKAYIGKIQTLTARGEYEAYSENKVLDALLNEKKWQAEGRGIEFIIDIESIKEANINDYDLCVIAGNLFDNAIEACDLIKNQKKWIKISAALRGDMFLLKVENSMDGITIKKGRRYISRKKEGGHGLGLQSTEEAISRYKGRLRLEQEEGVFRTNVTMTVKTQIKRHM